MKLFIIQPINIALDPSDVGEVSELLGNPIVAAACSLAKEAAQAHLDGYHQDMGDDQDAKAPPIVWERRGKNLYGQSEYFQYRITEA